MQRHMAFGFVDGGHTRAAATEFSSDWVDPRQLVHSIVQSPYVADWAQGPKSGGPVVGRVTYYDARPESDSEADPGLLKYWSAIELLKDCQLGFGALRGKPRRQKRVDSLIAVDMLSGAYTGLFDVAVLVASDADFVPVVDEVKRRGVMVVVAAHKDKVADELKRSADRFVELGHTVGNTYNFFPVLHVR